MICHIPLFLSVISSIPRKAIKDATYVLDGKKLGKKSYTSWTNTEDGDGKGRAD